jgi:hypothetical protein
MTQCHLCLRLFRDLAAHINSRHMPRRRARSARDETRKDPT